MKIFLILFLFFGFQISGFSQVIYTLNSSESSLIIQGTSSVHDWESKVEDFDIEITLTDADLANLNIESLVLLAKAKSIKSGKRIMDKKILSALKEEDFPNIRFELTEVQSTNEDSTNVFGMLTMAGNSQEVMVVGKISTWENGIKITGNKKLLMSDFEIEPPTAMLGTLKTGDEVTIEFNFFLKQQQSEE